LEFRFPKHFLDVFGTHPTHLSSSTAPRNEIPMERTAGGVEGSKGDRKGKDGTAGEGGHGLGAEGNKEFGQH